MRCKNCGKVLGPSRPGALSAFLMHDLRCSCGFVADNSDSSNKRVGKTSGESTGQKANKGSNEASSELCQRCGKTIAEKSQGGSITQFVFGDSRCRCKTPLKARQIKLDERKFATLTHRWTKGENDDSSHQIAPKQVFAPGTIIGGAYVIESLIGQGGMGSVYKVHHKTLGRQSALKVLDRALIDEKNWKRFQIEAKSISSLNHSCFVQVYDLALHEDKQPYYVMDILDGVTLDEVLKDGPLDARQAVELFLDMADGLAFAHRQGVIHRDLKPANIFIEEQADGNHTIKILDFGIAKLVGIDREEQSLTSLGDVFGSPFYMSPEQCLGETVDARSDIYSFGCSLFEAIAGRPPFDSELPMEIVEAHISEPCPPLSEVTGAHLLPGLSALVEKCLEKDPAERYQNMDQVIAHLRLVLKGEGAMLDDSYRAVQTVAARSGFTGSQSAQSQTADADGVSRTNLATASLITGAILAVGISSWAIIAILHPTPQRTPRVSVEFYDGAKVSSQADVSLKAYESHQKQAKYEPSSIKSTLNVLDVSTSPSDTETKPLQMDSARDDALVSAIEKKAGPRRPRASKPPEIVTINGAQFYKINFGTNTSCGMFLMDSGKERTIDLAYEKLLPLHPQIARLSVRTDKSELNEAILHLPENSGMPKALNALPDNYLTEIVLTGPFKEEIARLLERQKRIQTWALSGEANTKHFSMLLKRDNVYNLFLPNTGSIDSDSLINYLEDKRSYPLDSFRFEGKVSELSRLLDALSKHSKLSVLDLAQPSFTKSDIAKLSTMTHLQGLALRTTTPCLTESELAQLSNLKDLNSFVATPVRLSPKAIPTLLSMKKLSRLELTLERDNWSKQDKETLRKTLHIAPNKFSVKAATTPTKKQRFFD